MKKMIMAITTATTLFSLQACVPAFIVGAAAGGAAVYERKSIQTFTEDLNIHDKINNQIQKMTQDTNDSHLTAAVFNHNVLLVGQTPDESLRAQVEQIARNTDLVRHVYNEITISAPTSALTRSSDAWITTKVKGALLGIKGLKSTNFKVVTENGVVYLMGIVTQDQSSMAIDSARRVAGVQKVVKVFEYQ